MLDMVTVEEKIQQDSFHYDKIVVCCDATFMLELIEAPHGMFVQPTANHTDDRLHVVQMHTVE